jgi:hypothetical protein
MPEQLDEGWLTNLKDLKRLEDKSIAERDCYRIQAGCSWSDEPLPPAVVEFIDAIRKGLSQNPQDETSVPPQLTCAFAVNGFS